MLDEMLYPTLKERIRSYSEFAMHQNHHGNKCNTCISVLPPSSSRIAKRMLSWKIFSFLVFMIRSDTSLVAPSLSSRHWTAAMTDQSWSCPVCKQTLKRKEAKFKIYSQIVRGEKLTYWVMYLLWICKFMFH